MTASVKNVRLIPAAQGPDEKHSRRQTWAQMNGVANPRLAMFGVPVDGPSRRLPLPTLAIPEAETATSPTLDLGDSDLTLLETNPTTVAIAGGQAATPGNGGDEQTETHGKGTDWQADTPSDEDDWQDGEGDGESDNGDSRSSSSVVRCPSRAS